MNPLPRPLLPAALALAATGVVGLLAGCSSSGGQGSSTPTVTVTESTTPTSSATSSPTATSDVKGRAHDLGTISKVSTVGTDTVVEIDRWTVDGMGDPELAKEGVPVAPHRGQLYSNQNTEKTYTAVVAPGAQVVVNTCVVAPSGELGMTSNPVPAESWLKSPDTTSVLAIRYDSSGEITRMDTDPICR